MVTKIENNDEPNVKTKKEPTSQKTKTTATATATKKITKEIEIEPKNIYEKLFVLQEKIKVKKANKNEFADFKYRNINDIFIELKPLLKETKTILRFTNGQITAPEDITREKYLLTLELINLEDLDNNIIEKGEIYIDRTKRKMDLSQICLAAKTFLKKSMLEDLLLINEDDDPDAHDNTQNKNNYNKNNYNKNNYPQKNTSYQQNNNNSNNKKEQKPELDNQEKTYYKTVLHWMLMKKANKKEDEAKKILKQETEFKAKNKTIEGVETIEKLTDTRLKYTFNEFKKKYGELFLEMTTKYDERLKKDADERLKKDAK